MTPNELYKVTPVSKLTESEAIECLSGCYYNHMPDLNLESYAMSTESKNANTRLTVLIYRWHWFDHRRYWRLGAVAFDDQPFMIIRNAGREGDDHHSRFITDSNLYIQAVDYLNSLLKRQEYNLENTVDPEKDISDLTEFYGERLDGYMTMYLEGEWILILSVVFVLQ